GGGREVARFPGRLPARTEEEDGRGGESLHRIPQFAWHVRPDHGGFAVAEHVGGPRDATVRIAAEATRADGTVHRLASRGGGAGRADRRSRKGTGRRLRPHQDPARYGAAAARTDARCESER